MYHIRRPKEIISGLQHHNTQLKVIEDLLDAEVDCEEIETHLVTVFEYLKKHLPRFTSPTIKENFIIGVMKIAKEYRIDLFDLIRDLFSWLQPYSTEQFHELLLKYPEYLPLIYENKDLQNVSDEVLCASISQFMSIEEHRDDIPFERYAFLLGMLSHNLFDKGCDIISYPGGNNFIKNILTYSSRDRELILQHHIDLYRNVVNARKEYDDIEQGLYTLYQEEYEIDGFNPLPMMILEKFLMEEVRIMILKYERDTKNGF